MFADDTNLCISDSNIENLFETMNEKLRKVATWFKANKLSLNISKTKYPLFHSTRKRKYVQGATNRLFNVQMYAKKKILSTPSF